MAEGTPIGALAVSITADIGDFLQMMGRADSALEKFGRKVDKHTKEIVKFGAAAAAASAAVFGLTKSMNDFADEAGKTAQKTGMTAEAYSGLAYAARLADLSNDQLATGLKQLAKNMVEAQAGTGDALGAFKSLGIAVSDSGGKIKTTEAVLLELAEKFAGAEDGATKTAIAMKIFGKSGADLIPFLNQGRDGIEALRKEAERLGVIISTEAAKRAEEFNDNLTRLKASATGLAIELSGPLVTALNKAAEAMVQGRMRGETFFETLIEGFRRLVTGDDAHKWNVEFSEATNRLLEAQKQVDRLGNIGGWAAARGLKKARDEIAAAEADIKRLLAIKPILAPDEKPAEPGKPKSPLAAPEDTARSQRDADLIAKQGQEALEVEAQIRSEAAQATDDFRRAEREKEKAFQDQRIKDLIEAYDREQEAAIAHGQEIIDIDEEIAKQKKDLQGDQVKGAQQFFGNMASLMNTSSRKTFEVGKAAAMAEAGVKTTLATIEAYEFGTKIGGPYVGAAFAASAAIAGLNYMNNLRQQTFGGGGGPPSPQGQGSSGVAAEATAPAAQAPRGPDTFITLNGDRFGRKQVREVLQEIGEEHRDGGRVVVLDR